MTVLVPVGIAEADDVEEVEENEEVDDDDEEVNADEAAADDAAIELVATDDEGMEEVTDELAPED